MRYFLSVFLLAMCFEAQAFTVSDAKLECLGKRHVNEKISLNLHVDDDVGIPGLVYLAIRYPTTNKAYFYTTEQKWEEWDSGAMPVYRIMRNGLEDMTIEAPLNGPHFVGSEVYVGYGRYTSQIDAEVANRRDAITRIEQEFPDRPVYDPGDDYVRRQLIEKEMKDNQRYVKVMDITGCGFSSSIGIDR
jgi:hypothetical protein